MNTAGHPTSSARAATSSSPPSIRLSVGVSAARKSVCAILIAISIVVMLPLGVVISSALADSNLEALAVGGPIVLGLLWAAPRFPDR